MSSSQWAAPRRWFTTRTATDVAKSVSGAVTRYLVDDLNPTGYPQVIDELNGSGVITRTYTYGLRRIDEEQLISSTWTSRSYYGYDGGGNVRQLTNSAGTVTDTYDYDAWGNEVHHTGTTPNNYLYRGEQYDSDLSLYYLRARYFQPAHREVHASGEIRRIRNSSRFNRYPDRSECPAQVSVCWR